MDLTTITTPTLLLDPERARTNLARISAKTREQNITLRPHFKTHQSHTIGEWFREEGINKITVSSVGMAQYFAQAGWKDILIAFPCNTRQIAELEALAKDTHTGVVVLDTHTIRLLGRGITSAMDLWIKIDVGTHRTGIDPNESGLLDSLVEEISAFPHLTFAGVLAHAGHSYHSRNAAEVQRHHDLAVSLLWEVKKRYQADFPDLKISLGDTPGASMIRQYGPVDELRPGNFIFYDLMQHEIGACTADEIAVAMACPVVARHPERLQWIVYGGAIHFAKDFLTMDDGRRCFGRMANWNGQTWVTDEIMHNPFLISLSQEHGIVQCDEHTFDRCQPGDLAMFLPVHSCLTADCMGAYTDLHGSRIDHYRGYDRTTRFQKTP